MYFNSNQEIEDVQMPVLEDEGGEDGDVEDRINSLNHAIDGPDDDTTNQMQDLADVRFRSIAHFHNIVMSSCLRDTYWRSKK